MVYTGTMVAGHKSPELTAQEDLQNAISQHRDAIQLALRRYTRLLILSSTPCPRFSNLCLNANGQLEHVLRQILNMLVSDSVSPAGCLIKQRMSLC